MSSLNPAEPLWTDSQLADAFVDRHQNDIRYVAELRKWFTRNGNKQWKPDRVLHVTNLARAICREYAKAAMQTPGAEHLARSLVSASRIKAVIAMARCDQRIVCTAAEIGGK